MTEGFDDCIDTTSEIWVYENSMISDLVFVFLAPESRGVY